MAYQKTEWANSNLPGINADNLMHIEEGIEAAHESMGKILWTNPNPTVSFSAQTITLSTNDYDMYEAIYYSSSTLATQMTTGRIKKGETLFLQQIYYDTNSAQVRSRQRDISYDSDLSLNVQDAKNNGNVQNTDLIPAYIIGYKTGLFDQEVNHE